MEQYWFDRRSGSWWSFDADLKKSYYKFLRAVYGFTADQAWKHTKATFAKCKW